MKKLLSLLSVLTISGTAVPITISASPYQKQLNNNDYLQTNNLENLIRNKRQTKTLSLSDYLEFNNKYIEKINGIFNSVLQLEIDNQNNVYFRTYNNGDYLLKNGETQATKIEGITENIFDISIDKGNINNNNNNIY